MSAHNSQSAGAREIAFAPGVPDNLKWRRGTGSFHRAA